MSGHLKARMAEDLRLSEGFVLKIWWVAESTTKLPVEIQTERSVIGRVADVFDDHLLLMTNRGDSSQYVYYDKISRFKKMPDPGQFSTITQNARIHYESGKESWEGGDYQDWTVGACVQDVRKLLEVIEVMEAERR